MNKSQMKLLAVGVVSVLAISFLPKYVVHNDPQALSEVSESQEEMTSGTAESMAQHKSLVPESVQSTIEKLKKQFENSQNPKEKLKFADSLFILFRKYNELESAAKFAELRIPSPAALEDWLKAGNAHYQVFSVAFSAQQAKASGDKARKYFEKVLVMAPDSLGVKARLAMTLVTSEQPMQAALKLREVLEADPNQTEGLYNMGMLSIQSGQFAKGIGRFQKLVELNPMHLQAHYFLGVCYFESGKKQLAKKQFELVKNMSADPVVQNEAEKYLERI